MIEVLKQALEALEIYWGKAEHRRTREDERRAESAITSLRQAIAGLESQEPVGEFGWAANIPNTIGEVHWKNGSPPIGTKLYTHPPQRTEQEPVVYCEIHHLPEPCVQCAKEHEGYNTAPPQRTKVVFPTMLRQMWSGGEVQAWLDENVNKEKS